MRRCSARCPSPAPTSWSPRTSWPRKTAPPGSTPSPGPIPKYERFRSEATAFEAIAGYGGPTNLNLIGPDGPERLAAEEVGGSYFSVLGLAPGRGASVRCLL